MLHAPRSMGRRDDEFWAGFLGIAPLEWASQGVSVRAHAGLAGFVGLWCFRHAARTVVSAPPAWVTPLAARVDGCDPESLFDESFLRELLGTDFELLVGPAFQGCLEVGRFRPSPSSNVRLVRPEDSSAVQRFRSECGEDAWQSGGQGKVERHVVAHFEGDIITAMAGYRSWSDVAGDPCVLTHPDYRRRGHGTAVVSSVVGAALEEGQVLLYQTLEANRGAVGIATGLGYEQYARHVAVRLKRESP